MDGRTDRTAVSKTRAKMIAHVYFLFDRGACL